MTPKALSTLALGLLFASSAMGIIVSGNDPNSITNNGSAYTGVVRVYGAGGFCTGTLFEPSRTYVLTAAHCVTDANANPTTVGGTSYVGIDGATSIGVVDYIANAYVAPGYVGQSNGYANDIAVVKLQDAAPLDAAFYSLYTSTNELGKEVILVGHGAGGTGTTGPEAQYSQSAELSGRRMGTNIYDVLASTLDGTDDTHILWDFDGPMNTYNAFGYYGYSNSPSTGPPQAPTEVTIAGGDSGGPSFYNGMIIGVHSYTTCFSNDQVHCNTPPAYDSALDDKFGNIGGDTRVSLYTGANGFLTQFVTSVPEPATWALMGTGLIGFALRFRRRRA